MNRAGSTRRAAGLAVTLLALAGCTPGVDAIATASLSPKPLGYSQKERECMERAMFFESNRSSRDGLVAVGTVVMNRVASEAFPDTVCGVVGQKGQFAPGVMSRPMNSKALPDVQAAADAVLRGERHPGVQRSKFFHTAGLTFPYRNMHYVLVAGGNAFYEKRPRNQVTQRVQPPPIERTAAAMGKATPSTALSYEAPPDTADPIGAMILDGTAARAE